MLENDTSSVKRYGILVVFPKYLVLYFNCFGYKEVVSYRLAEMAGVVKKGQAKVVIKLSKIVTCPS
jgi:hypothetical protein